MQVAADHINELMSQMLESTWQAYTSLRRSNDQHFHSTADDQRIQISRCRPSVLSRSGIDFPFVACVSFYCGAVCERAQETITTATVLCMRVLIMHE